MDEVCKWLGSGGAFVKIRTLSSKGIRRDDRLRMKAITADRTAQFDLTESSHKPSSGYMKSWKEISVPVFSRESGYIALVQNFPAEYFLASKSAPRSVITHDPVVDAD
jgi:hypothetical protein